jgi:hypothetical protein
MTVAFVLLATTASAEGELYRCSAKEVVRADDEGGIARYQNNVWADHWSGILVDTATGVIRRSDGEREQWTIVQRGSPENDWVATPAGTLVSASTDLVRIRAWQEKPRVTFIAFAFSTFVTGTCEVAR